VPVTISNASNDWFEEGNGIPQAGNVDFKVHQSASKKNSAVFEVKL